MDDEHLRLCRDAYLMASLCNDPLGYLTEELGQDCAVHVVNAATSFYRSLEKDTPAKRWWHLDAHPAVARALRIDASTPEARYALMPFRLARTAEGQAVIAAAYPCPHFLTDVEHWLAIETVILWNPVDNTVTVEGDAGPQIIGDPATGNIYGDPRAFFQDWARQRAQFYVQRQASIANHWTAPLAERDDAPGVLIVGDAAKVHLPIYELPEVITTIGIDAKVINRAILKSARLPRVQDNLRKVA